MIVHRTLLPHLVRMMTKFPVITLTGPRQSGKTTLIRHGFPDMKYFNLERIDHRQMIMEDPAGFLKRSGSGIIFDEAQNLPELFSYIQVESDERNIPGQYILSGSQSFLMNSHIAQSLAGRAYVSHLFPYTIEELGTIQSVEEMIFKGFYPRLHEAEIHPADFYPSYLQTYIERDIRTLKAIENLNAFSRFLALCAGRTGQILNLTSLANDTGISVNTAKSWLSLLESSFIVFLLQPYYKNYNKRIIKSPKLYFYDTGIVCSLLQIRNPEMIHTHYLRGALFENLMISEIIKMFYHQGKRPPVYYWRESNGSEIDCLVEMVSGKIATIEIKAGQTYNRDFLLNLKKFPDPGSRKIVIYTGDQSFESGDTSIIPFRNSGELLIDITS